MAKTKILVPTDFSECANNALNYAIALATDINAEIILMHSIIYNDSSFIDATSVEEENTKRYNESKEKLDQALNYVKSTNTGLNVKTHLDGEFAELSISSIIDSEKIDYIVMGTEGASGLKAVIFGSFTNNVLLIATCPVFTIPITAKYKGIKTIICATEMEESETDAIKRSIELAKIFEAKITFYNVNSNKKEQKILFNKFETLIKKITNYPSINYELAESHDIVEAIDDYVCEKNPDLLVTLGKERNFFDQLFGKKVTKKLCMHTTAPLLSFPSYDSRRKEKDTSDLVKKNIKTR